VEHTLFVAPASASPDAGARTCEGEGPVSQILGGLNGAALAQINVLRREGASSEKTERTLQHTRAGAGAGRRASVGEVLYACFLENVSSRSGVRTSQRLRYCLRKLDSFITQPSFRMSLGLIRGALIVAMQLLSEPCFPQAARSSA